MHLSIQNSSASIFSLLLENSTVVALEIKDVDGLPAMWHALERLQGESATQNRIQGMPLASDFFASQLIAAGASPNTVS